MNKAYNVSVPVRAIWQNLHHVQCSVVYCTYRMVITSMLTYDSAVRWPGFMCKISRMELIKLQRLDCLVITWAMRTAPNVAMQVLLFM